MPTTPEGFAHRLEQLRADLFEQGRRVQAILETAFEGVFARDAGAAARVQAQDDVIDRADVAIEKAAVTLLTDATREASRLEPRQLRAVLTIVKVNNELERIADCAVDIAEQLPALEALHMPVPERFRVMTNSVLGILRDVNRALDQMDPSLAKLVLRSEDTVTAFKEAILRDAEMLIASGTMNVDFAFILNEIATQCEIAADHCTNIAEQVIYSATGAIVRHMHGKWHEVPSSQV